MHFGRINLCHLTALLTADTSATESSRRYVYAPFADPRLCSLSPEHPDYVGVYGGSRIARDGAYHQGTTWGWLIGPYVAAHLRVYHDAQRAGSFLQPLLRHLNGHCVGSLSEIFDGDAPFTPRGCNAQAWTVAELLRCWALTTPTT